VRGVPPRTVVLLKPGESLTYWISLDLRGLPEGEYSIQVLYHAMGLLRAPMNLASNDVSLEIATR
jgi:hypothetical protein